MIQHLDTAILSLPIAATFGAGVGFRCMEESSIALGQVVGWLGSRACMVMTVSASMPLFIYSCASNILAHGLNYAVKVATDKEQPLLKSFAEHTELRLKISLLAALSMPLLIMAGPSVVQNTKKCVEVYINGFKALQRYQAGEIKFTEALETISLSIRNTFNL